MAVKPSRTPPLACRPKKLNEWLYKAIDKERKKLTRSELIETILINHYSKSKK